MFLPGAGEIRRVQARLREADLGNDVDVLPLYGELAPGEQDAALAPARAGRRKVVLATNIAETSLTIDGVRVVVDCGLERRNVFDPGERHEPARDAAHLARLGRAARGPRGPHRARRLLSALGRERASARSRRTRRPRSLNADLAPLALDLAVWGTDAASLSWLDAPPAATLASARDLLRRLGALDAAGRVTAHGRAMHELGAHPRLAHMLLAAREHGAGRPRPSSRRCFPSATCCAARARDRGATRQRRAQPLRRAAPRARRRARGVDRGALERVRRAERAFLSSSACARRRARRFAARARACCSRSRIPTESRSAGRAATRAISSRTAAARRSRARNRSRARSSSSPSTSTTASRDARILLAAPLDRGDLLEHFARAARARATRSRGTRAPKPWSRAARCGSASSCSRRSRCSDAAARRGRRRDARRLALARARRRCRGTTRAATSRRAASSCARSAASDLGDWPDLSDAALATRPRAGSSRFSQASRGARISSACRSRRAARTAHATSSSAGSTSSRRRTSRCRPARARGSTIATTTRRARRCGCRRCSGSRRRRASAAARCRVTFKLLSPAHRPLQVTRDLASFWRNAYVDVRKDMRGRYPRHYWPENPLEAEPTRRAKPRR